MDIHRQWYCTCSGQPRELSQRDTLADERGEPFCERCGATPSSDPRKTISFRDESRWDD